MERLLFERGHHLLGEDLEAARLLRQRQEPAWVQLGRDAVQAELLAKLCEAIHERRARTERDLGAEDLLVRERRERLGLRDPPLGRAGASASNRCAGQIGLALEVVRDRLLRLLKRSLLGWGGVHRNPQAHVAVPGVSGFAPGFAIALHVHGQLGGGHAAKTHEDRQARPADERYSFGGPPGTTSRMMSLSG